MTWVREREHDDDRFCGGWSCGGIKTQKRQSPGIYRRTLPRSSSELSLHHHSTKHTASPTAPAEWCDLVKVWADGNELPGESEERPASATATCTNSVWLFFFFLFVGGINVGSWINERKKRNNYEKTEESRKHCQVDGITRRKLVNKRNNQVGGRTCTSLELSTTLYRVTSIGNRITCMDIWWTAVEVRWRVWMRFERTERAWDTVQ